MRPIETIAARAGFPAASVIPHGNDKAKIAIDPLERPADRPRGRYILVTGMTPTQFGEGKTTTSIGLAMALCRLGRNAIATLRQPSMGPVFGIKGGGTGGGRAHLVPEAEINLHLTGDFHAIAAANNLLAAHIDTTILLKNPHAIDPTSVTWRRVVDINDRALRCVVTGLGGRRNGVPRETGFDIVPASEVMAILGLSQGWQDLRSRLGRIMIGHTRDGDPVTAETLRCAGAMAAILRDALCPNLVATCEGTPALVHTGPFADIAHGASSIVADMLALRYADYVVTEAGFGADMGAEKFFNLKCRLSGLTPDAAVLVATVRATKTHGARDLGARDLGARDPASRDQGVRDERASLKMPLAGRDPQLEEVNPELVAVGCENLRAQIEIVRRHGVPVVVAINRMPGDAESEHAVIRERALAAGAVHVEVSECFEKGSAGGVALAEAVEVAAQMGTDFRHLYPLEQPLDVKIETIAREIYGAARTIYAPGVRRELERFAAQGFGALPICIAKTPLSLSDDPTKKNRPRGFDFLVSEARVYAGAGYVCPLAGTRSTMPGLPAEPRLVSIDLNEKGEVVGL
ncbi:MAG: formate--tetrahydrofolate ligase [Planctomycetota bacterium]